MRPIRGLPVHLKGQLVLSLSAVLCKSQPSLERAVTIFYIILYYYCFLVKVIKKISISKNYYNFTHFASCSLNLLLLHAHLRVWEFHDEVNLSSLWHFIHPSKWSLFYTSRCCSDVTQPRIWLIVHGLFVLSHHIYQLAAAGSQYLLKPDCIVCLSGIICSSSLATPRWVWGQ